MDALSPGAKAVRRGRTAFVLSSPCQPYIIGIMRNAAIGEEQSLDHFHLTAHLVMPHPGGREIPVFQANTARHSNNHLIATGPLLACPALDAPYPVPGLDFREYVAAVLNTMAVLLDGNIVQMAYGTGGRKIPPRVLPVPPSNPEPLW